ncbi:SCO3242 family prenyltransferase [Streptomyces sp. NPDC005476]|uniref:SCO3242 family prenyltransferase n=1 Tax=Streptomyces sp. NPDC005476 TaxID=3156882 RepID=UPI0034562695
MSRDRAVRRAVGRVIPAGTGPQGRADGRAAPGAGTADGRVERGGGTADECARDSRAASGACTADAQTGSRGTSASGTSHWPAAAAGDAAATGRARVRAWAELLRVPALFTVPGDALAGAGALCAPPGHRTLLAIGSSLCLYEAGMVLNDWADRAEDAAERPHRPLPSGRVSPTTAFTVACAFTAAGLALAARAGRPALTIAAPLAVTVWSYDLALKHTPAGPFAMAAARGLDLLLGAAATGGRTRPALASAALLATHTCAVTNLSRQETHEGTPTAALAALATTGALTWLLHRPLPPGGPPHHLSRNHLPRNRQSSNRRSPAEEAPGRHQPPGRAGHRPAPSSAPLTSVLTSVLATGYAAATARSSLHASLNPSPPLTQRAVGAGIRATIPLQAALMARSGATATALITAALAPVARRLARRVSIT